MLSAGCHVPKSESLFVCVFTFTETRPKGRHEVYDVNLSKVLIKNVP